MASSHDQRRGSSRPDEATTLVHLVHEWARLTPDEPAYTYFVDGHATTLSYRALEARALALAARLVEHGWQGQWALLLYPSGLDFVVAFFGCLYAGVTAVPVPAGRGKAMRERVLAIARDAEPRVLLTTREWAHTHLELTQHEGALGELVLCIEDDAPPAATRVELPLPGPDELAFLQYTSGSTAQCKGIMITHANVMANNRMIEQGCATGPSTVIVTWLPMFHDMGLVGMMIHAAYLGAHAVLLPTLAVLRQPLLWLQAFDRFRGTFSAAPNFAYDLCVSRTTAEERARLDLSSWSCAVNGSEPVRAATLQRFATAFAPSGFRASSLAPSYGLAEATLIVSGRTGQTPTVLKVDAERLQSDGVSLTDSGRAQPVVGCGASLQEQTLAIVDPHTLEPRRPGQVGEIWIAGAHVARGYFRKPEATAETFEARLPGDERRYLRTGDLGFVHQGDLFITGRIKDVIIVRGQKYYPQDLELVVQAASEHIRPDAVAAFGIEVAEQPRVVIVAEVDRQQHADADLLARLVRAIRERYELPLHELLLVARGNVPKTTSGKIQRQRCRRDYLADALTVHGRWRDLGSAAALRQDVAARVEQHARRWLEQRRAIDPAEIDPTVALSVLGLDSISRLDLIHSVERAFDRHVPEHRAHELETIRQLAELVAGDEPPESETRGPAAQDHSDGSALVLPAIAALSWSPRK